MTDGQASVVRRVIAEMRMCRWHSNRGVLALWADELDAVLGERQPDRVLLPGIPGHSHVVRADGTLLCGCVWPEKG